MTADITAGKRGSTQARPSPVCTHNEWDPLEEVIIGNAAGARRPLPGIDLYAIEYRDVGAIEQVPSGRFPADLLAETAEELEQLCDALRSLGVTVRRPGPRDKSAVIETPDWRTDGFYDYCPRDVLLVVGDNMIETPMVLRSRFLESFAYRGLLLEYFQAGARWISAPKPRLMDELYDPDGRPGERLLDLEPAFDAANVVRLGTDLLYLVSDSGNEQGARWLQSTLGDTYTVHPCRGIYASTHIDSTIVPLRPGLVLLNPARVNDHNLPGVLRSWDKLNCPQLTEVPYVGDRPQCSNWIGMNVLVVRPDLLIVDDRQPRLIRQLEQHGFDVLPLRLTHARSLGGGFHCVSIDIRRAGQLESYA